MTKRGTNYWFLCLACVNAYSHYIFNVEQKSMLSCAYLFILITTMLVMFYVRTRVERPELSRQLTYKFKLFLKNYLKSCTTKLLYLFADISESPAVFVMIVITVYVSNAAFLTVTYMYIFDVIYPIENIALFWSFVYMCLDSDFNT